MIKVNVALKVILNSVKVLDSETIPLINSLNRVLAADMYSDNDIPAFDNSAMDGYAVKSTDLTGASKETPKTLEVVDDLKAGGIPKKILRNNQAIRIMTGAVIPKGADSVIMVEDTKKIKNQKSKIKNKEYIEIFKQIKMGENVRKRGEDIKKGELVIKKGTLLNPAHIGIFASLGKARIKVMRKPKVAILATGDEVVDVDDKLEPGKIRSSNTYSLYSQVLKSGGIPRNLGIARDKPEQLEKKIKQGLDCNLILTSGGVSAGDYDLVKDILAKMGTNIHFWKVAMRPGKPIVFGTISATRRGGSAKNFGGKGIPVFGLPGNPVSSMVSFEIFVRPAILKMLGQEEYELKEIEATLEEDIKKKKGFRYFLRANTRWQQDGYLTRTTGPQGSGILKSMALANSLIILSEENEYIKKGEKVMVKFLD